MTRHACLIAAPAEMHAHFWTDRGALTRRVVALALVEDGIGGNRPVHLIEGRSGLSVAEDLAAFAGVGFGVQETPEVRDELNRMKAATVKLMAAADAKRARTLCGTAADGPERER